MKAQILKVGFLFLAAVAMSADLPSVANLIIHLKADSITGVNDGGVVNLWVDSSRTADCVDGNVSAVKGEGKPTWHAMGAGARPTVRFTSDVLNSSEFFWPNPAGGITILAVFTGDTSGAGAERMAQIGSATGAGGKSVALDVSTSMTSGSGFRFNNGYAVTEPNNPLTTDYHIGVWQIWQGGQHQSALYYVDNLTAQQLETNNPTRTMIFPYEGNTLTLGTGIQNGDFMNGDAYGGYLSEILVYNRHLTSTEIGSICGYLYSKYFDSVISASPDKLYLNEGESAEVEVSLNFKPTSDVVVSITGTTGQVTCSPQTLIFTPDNWDQPRSIQVITTDNILLEGRQSQAVVALKSVSYDRNYADARKAVTMIVFENECGPWAYTAGDMNEDCRVDISDLAQLSFHWLWCDPMIDDLCFNFN